jgi:carbonic anhydrase/acetyltransferase-like protein (isoleucine patch superfamily)
VLHACRIGDRCLIGMGAIVLDGAVIEDDVMLAAGSLVSPGKHPGIGLALPRPPGRKGRRLTEKELEMLRYSAANYVRLKDQYVEGAVKGKR